MSKPLADDMPSDSVFYVITLCSASLPMPLQVPFVHELVGFSVFRTRCVEDGRERFRLHLGYFDSQMRAGEALAVVRRYFPAAWISSAPRNDQSSLDDTLNTAFRIIKTAQARVAGPEAQAQGAEQYTDKYLQRYVIQLAWSAEPIVARTIPQLPSFRSYYLYSVRALRDGRPQHGLRLGFFKNIKLAQQTADLSRAQYPRLTVLPISHREYTRAVDLVQKRALKALSATGPANALSLDARQL